MKILKYILAIILLFFSSCTSDKKDEKILNVEMGSVEFEEPFVWFIKSRPTILVKSLDYIPFSWFAPDTTAIEQEFEVTFNDDCIRSKSEVNIAITDTLKKPANGLRVKFDDNAESTVYKVSAAKGNQTIKVRYKVKPELGDTLYRGYVIVDSDNLDYINENSLQNGDNIAARWSIKQEIDQPWILWGLWLLTFVLLVFIVVKLLIFFIPIVVSLIGSFFSGLGSVISTICKAVSAALKVASTTKSFNFTGKCSFDFGNKDFKKDGEVNTDVNDTTNNSIDKDIQSSIKDASDFLHEVYDDDDLQNLYNKIEQFEKWAKRSGHCLEFICGYYDGKKHFQFFLNHVNEKSYLYNSRGDVRDRNPYLGYIEGALKSERNIEIPSEFRMLPIGSSINMTYNEAYALGCNAVIEHNTIVNGYNYISSDSSKTKLRRLKSILNENDCIDRESDDESEKSKMKRLYMTAFIAGFFKERFL